MKRPEVKELKKSEAVNKEVVNDLVHGSAPVADKPKKKKYIVNIMFDPDWEQSIRARAKEKGLTVAGYIKTLVGQDINE